MTKQINELNINMCKIFIKEIVGSIIFILSIIIACLVCLFSSPFTIVNPLMLLFASAFILIPFRNQSLCILQQIICFYMIAVAINQLAPQYIELSMISSQIIVSKAAVFLLICSSGIIFDRMKEPELQQDPFRKVLIYSSCIGFLIISIHIILLYLLLRKFYWYGYEHNINVLGNIFLYLILFLLTWKKIGNIRQRQYVGLIFGAFFLFLTIFVIAVSLETISYFCFLNFIVRLVSRTSPFRYFKTSGSIFIIILLLHRLIHEYPLSTLNLRLNLLKY